MVKESLVGAAIETGAILLRELDRAQFPVDSMFWALLHESRWRLVIGSSLIEDGGSRLAYQRLGAILRETDFGLSLMNISVFEQNSTELASLLSAVEGSGDIAAGARWVAFAEGVVYRWTGDAIACGLTCHPTLAEVEALWERERKLTLLPKLLFEEYSGHFILRLHPQHGPSWKLSEVKRAFPFALHRSYPNCQIEWLDSVLTPPAR